MNKFSSLKGREDDMVRAHEELNVRLAKFSQGSYIDAKTPDSSPAVMFLSNHRPCPDSYHHHNNRWMTSPSAATA